MANWKIRAGAMLAVLVALGSALVMANNAIDNATSIWGKLELLFSYAATPWIGVMCLVAVVVLLTWGTRDVIAAQAKLAAGAIEADAAIAAQGREAQVAHDWEIVAAQKAASRLPLLLAKLDLKHKELAWLNAFILDFEGRLESYKKNIEQWQNDDGFNIDSSSRPMPPDMAFAAHPPQFLTFQAPGLPGDWKVEPIVSTSVDAMRWIKIFEQKNHPLLPAALAHNVRIATDYAQELRKIAEQEHQALPRLLHEIERELANYE